MLPGHVTQTTHLCDTGDNVCSCRLANTLQVDAVPTCQLYLKLITLNSNNSLYKHWLLLPEMLLLFKGTCCWMKDDDIACCRIPKTRFDMWQVIL